MVTIRKSKILVLFTALAIFMAACAPSDAELTPTADVIAVRTEAVSTFAFGLTQTQIARPTATTTPTPIPTVSPVAVNTLALTTGTVQAGAPVASCNNMSYVRDVTVPDNTQMTPGQAFTKTWEVKNSGTCAWAAGFRLSLVSGEAMGGQTFTISQAVAAGATTQLSVPMTAPTNKTGTLRGDWRMADAAGTFFGDQIYVQVVVGGAGTGPTSTTGAPATAVTPPAPTVTP